MPTATHATLWLRHGRQSLGLIPSLGGSVAAWRFAQGEGSTFDLWRPWQGEPDVFRTASFAMVPWSNRISGGGFTHEGAFHEFRPNRPGETYPIHGDGWQQSWQVEAQDERSATLSLESRRFDGNPYHYRATQTFTLHDDGLRQSLTVQHLGDATLPYGLGLHPWFTRTSRSCVTAPVEGVWLSGKDPIPTRHTKDMPRSWNLSAGVPGYGSFIDNGYSGWGGNATIDWPGQRLRVAAAMQDFEANGGAAGHSCLVYRPLEGTALCFEPITQPIDAFHMPGMPGLRVLANGEQTGLDVDWRIETLGT